MQRAIQTAEIIKENINRDISIHKIKDTHEITSANILHGHKRDSEHVKNIRLIEEENSNNEDFKLEGRESTKEIKSGVCQFLDYLSSIEHDNAIVVTR